MTTHHPAAHPAFAQLLHGGDYNPDQWRHEPAVWDDDLRLMRLAHCNVMSVGIFSWAALEPEEGRFTFDWLDRIMDNLARHDVRVALATPSGAKPAWMALRYPETRRVQPNGLREHHGFRHNHCYTSPVYRDKTRIINTKLAERYAAHPALLLWHVSNEYGGECHCELCKQAFRHWLQQRYHSLDELNHAWWSGFWSHTFTAWEQIDYIDTSMHGMQLDWRRFVTDQTADFFRHEAEPLRRLTPRVPVTTNMMGFYEGLNYWKFAPLVDVISWDNYPDWHQTPEEWRTACHTAFTHDLNRSLRGGQPFLMIESTPSQTNWRDISPLKRPGMHMLASLQAVAHGSDAVMYFQWRKGRGGCEKFHGAVVDHAGHEHTRVFQDVAAVGAALAQLGALAGTSLAPEVALIHDWENGWAFSQSRGPRNRDKDYLDTCRAHYQPLWQRGIPADVIDMDGDFSRYRLLLAPLLYMVRPGVAERLAAFVADGGTLVTTYFSGIADQHDRCFPGGFPGPLRALLGIWAEETDALHEHQHQTVEACAGNQLGLHGSYAARHYCDLVHLDGAQALAHYGAQFYAGQPAVTVKPGGRGAAY